VALAWALDADEIGLGVRLLWLLELHLATGDPLAARAWIDAFLARAGDEIDVGLRARAVRVRGATYDMTGESGLAEREYEHARDLFDRAGDDEASAHLLNRIAMAALQQGDIDRAARLGGEALELDRRRGHRRDEAVALNLLGSVALARGDRDEGVRLMYRSAELAEEVGFDWWRGVTLGNLADWLLEAGELDEAERALIPSVEVIAQIDDRVNMPIMLATAAWLAAARGDAYTAGMFWGVVERGEDQRPNPAWAAQSERYREKVEIAGGTEFERGRADGHALSYEEALDAIRAPVD
jgi:tetratricopeptide (TPR) repeat protein